MVRFSAPQLEDDSHTTPMEWTAIPDENQDEDEMSNSFSLFGLGSSRRRRDISSSSVTNTIEIDGSGREIICLDDSPSKDGGADYSNRSVANSSNNSPQIAPTAQDLYHSLRTMHEDYIQSVNMQMIEQQQHDRRRRCRRYIFGVTIFAFVGLVLYKYAPPPPPLNIVLPSASVAGDSNIMSMTQDFVPKSDLSMQQHDSWTTYCLDTLKFFTDATLHQLSVFWYALSNAFSYGAKEVRLSFTNYIKQTFQSPANETKQSGQHKHNSFTKSWCPIRVPAASNRHSSLPRGANTHAPNNQDINLLYVSTEEFLRQSVGASLSPQNLALTLLAEGIDAWGKNLVDAAPVSLVHRMSASMETGLWLAEQNGNDDTQWILPPAMGLLLIGPEGVGKMHIARLLSRWMFGHCNVVDVGDACAAFSTEENGQHCTNELMKGHRETDRSREAQPSQQGPDGVLEIIAEDYPNNQHIDQVANQEDSHPIKESIVNHIIQRQHQGSVIILHHIEALPLSLLSELSRVITGKSDHLSYKNQDGSESSVSTNGTVFIFTSKQWGTKSIFSEIERNGLRTIGLRRESLLSSVRWEVDSHFQYRNKMVNHLTIAPVLPFQPEDLKSILRRRIQLINTKHLGIHWKQLQLSNNAIDYFLSTDHVEYFDLYGKDIDTSRVLTFSLRGANALEENALMQALHAKLLTGSRRRPYKVAFVDVDAMNDDKWETVFVWCDEDASGLLKDCEEEWRLIL